ncbi:hypothetical protein K503DRAFT_80188 [Rhizopogon vinicolor AM-OR11-026]|uniref:Uncharacterized protein n=1 Tax=Rhizopogon vinicolor AM-OR11-026 TaxID=1314800 RepID=A0A1B7MFX3_9AGAM|nr:hypothetical protein K503DRAFT_80188 [Rhizopogon vinicolor AM-OR11-026]
MRRLPYISTLGSSSCKCDIIRVVNPSTSRAVETSIPLCNLSRTLLVLTRGKVLGSRYAIERHIKRVRPQLLTHTKYS